MNPSASEFNSTNQGQESFTLVAFYISPLHIIYERELDREESWYNDGADLYDFDPFFLIRYDCLRVEDSKMLISDADEVKLKKRQMINSYFQNYFSFGFNLTSYNPPIPILTITFIYSVNIAFNPTLRSQFYNHYAGRVPAITQFLLNHLRLGKLADENFLYQLCLNPLYQQASWTTLGYLDIGINQKVSRDNSEEFSMMCAWFHLLEEHLSDTSFWFNHFVDLKKTPLVSKKPLTLTGFARGYASSSPTVEASPLKDKYVLLNRVLDIRYLSSDELAQGIQPYPKLDKLSDYPKEIYSDREYNEKYNQLSTELIRFITSCRPEDLEL